VSDFGEVIKQEERFAALYVSYSEAVKVFLTLPISKKKARKNALHALQASATAFFNSFERLVVFGSLSGAANDKVWYRDKADTALNLLEIIHHHYKAAFARAEELGEDLALFTPSLTAYATIERLVAESFPDDAQKRKKKFEELGLPVRGFVKGVRTLSSGGRWKRCQKGCKKKGPDTFPFNARLKNPNISLVGRSSVSPKSLLIVVWFLPSAGYALAEMPTSCHRQTLTKTSTMRKRNMAGTKARIMYIELKRGKIH
jgi:hypothetical protein